MRLFWLPTWLWLVLMVVLLVIGVVTQEPAAFVAVGASLGLAIVIGLIRKLLNGRDLPMAHERFKEKNFSEGLVGGRAGWRPEITVLPGFKDGIALELLTNRQLRELCEELGLPTKGLRRNLIRAIRTFEKDSSQRSEEPEPDEQ